MADEYALTITRGNPVAETFLFVDGTEDGPPTDITGRTYRAQLRHRSTSTDYVAAVVTVDDPDEGRIVVHLSDTQTAAITWPVGRMGLEETIDGVPVEILTVTVLVEGDYVR
ncbi:MAG TPA: hypothetical protein VF657_08335 [Actinoplanes sp.]|jgi:hypothetical protein